MIVEHILCVRLCVAVVNTSLDEVAALTLVSVCIALANPLAEAVTVGPGAAALVSL